MRKLFLLGVLLAPLWSFAQQSKVDSLKAVLATVKTDTAELRVLLDLCAQFQFLPRKDLLAYGQRAVNIAESEHRQRELSFGWYFIAMSYYYEGKYDDAAEAAEKCVAVIRETGNKTSMLDALTLMGAIYNQKGDHGKALDAHFESLAISEQLSDEAGKAFAYNNIGTVYFNNNQQADALKYFRKALTSYAAVGDSLYMGIVYSNLGELHPDPDSSIHYLTLALEVLERFEYEDAIAHVAANLGEVYTGKKDWPQAEKYLFLAIEIWEKTGLASGLNSPFRTLGRINAQRGNLPEAMQWFDKALENARGQSPVILKDTYLYMSETFRQIGQYKEALDYLSQADVLKDSLFNEEKAQQLVEAETRYHTNLLARQSAEKDLTIANQQNRQKNILIAAILVLLVVGGGFQYLRQRESLRKKEAETALRIQQAEADKLREVDKMKSSFFANISHEFRTPLTLILGPLEEGLSGASRNHQIPLKLEQNDARMMRRNANRLLELINQLLDLSRLEGGRLKLNVREGDLAQLFRAVAFSFESLATRKKVRYRIENQPEQIMGWFDADKVEKILANLLSNAFKFCRENGQVQVGLSLDNDLACIRVTDDGPGIPHGELDRIFDRFYQTAGQDESYGGTGIGLALVRELVNLHKGHIRVESEEGRGAGFTVRLPLEKEQYDAGSIEDKNDPAVFRPAAAGEEEPAPAPKSALATLDVESVKPQLLIVEDHEEVRAFIRERLKDQYHILEACDGPQGCQSAIEHIPDLVITDLMMPGIDGVELAGRLKKHPNTAHIPIIMLTARADQEDKLKGLDTGAEAYLTKPFDAQELRIRVARLIEQRRKLANRYQENALLNPLVITVSSVDDRFLKGVRETIRNHLDDESFGVPELGDAMGMSRSQLHRKLKALTGFSPNELIRNIRLEHGKALLEKGAGNASEVAFMVGFSSLSYFSKCFSDYFGYPPSKVE